MRPPRWRTQPKKPVLDSSLTRPTCQGCFPKHTETKMFIDCSVLLRSRGAGGAEITLKIRFSKY